MRPKKYSENKLTMLLNESPAPDQSCAPEIPNHPDGAIPQTLSPPCAINDCNSTTPDYLSPPCAYNEQSTRSARSGPNTEAGKKRSSMNAIRHGLSGRIVVLPSEDMSLYLAQSKEIVDSLYPETPIERKLAQTVADGYWRMERFRTVEEGMLAWGNYEDAGDFDADNENIHSAFTAAKAFRANSQAFVNLSIYEQRIQRGIDKAMKQLQELQTQRKERHAWGMDEAIRLHAFNQMMAANATPQNLGEDEQLVVKGFVYSNQEIELEVRRRDRCENAQVASKAGFDYQEYLKLAA
jgi:hypothetical protein